jgi:hypothetical protein
MTGAHLRCTISAPKACSASGEDKVGDGVLSPGADCRANEILVVRDDGGLCACVSVVEDDLADSWAGDVCGGVNGCGIADWDSVRQRRRRREGV